MQYILGCDGGATKAEYMIVDFAGNIVAHSKTPGIQYALLGKEGFEKALYADLDALLLSAGILKQDILCATLGMTNYGETKNSAEDMTEAAHNYFPIEKVCMMNDAVVGWSGSLGGKAGVNMVAGTGSIAYGQDEGGNGRRAGGYSIRFNDEGSCCWMGKEVAALFFKQADERIPRTALFDIVMEEYNLDDPMMFTDVLMAGPATDDAALAALQLLALKAYHAGDPCAEQLYVRAAKELSSVVATIIKKLDFKKNPVSVSYSGGLFKAGDCIIKPFEKEITSIGGVLVKPLYSPIIGAIIYGLLQLGMNEEIIKLADKIEAQL